AVTHLVLLVALLRARRQFVAPGDPATIGPLVQVASALVVCVPVASIYALDNDAFSERIEEALLLVIAGLGVRALWLLFRPFRVEPTEPAGRQRVEQLVHQRGTDSPAYFALPRDKTYFFSATGKSFLAYRVVAGYALIAGDPIGAAVERRAPVVELCRVTHD